MILYKQGKNKEIRVWEVWSEENRVLTKHGVLDGQMQISSKKVTGKNAGKANERTPEEQAVFTAQSMYNKQVDKGYCTTIEECKKPRLAPMKAKKYQERVKKIKWPTYIQPKLNGLRCFALWDGDRIKLGSRGNKEYIIPHLSDQLAKVLPKGNIIDGEIYTHKMTLQNINRLARKQRPESVQLDFWAYDYLSLDALEFTFEKRLQALNLLRSMIRTHSTYSIKITPTETVVDDDEVQQTLKGYEDAGFEGAIIREHHGLYELGNRSSHLLKLKNFMDKEFQIIGYKNGTGKYEDCVIWICRVEGDKVVDVVPKGSLEQKRKWYKEAGKYMGSWLTVSFQEYSEDGIPVFPVGEAIRLPEDME